MNNQGENKEFCSKCLGDEKLPLRSEVESLKQKLIDRNITIVQMEAKMAHDMPHVYTQGQLATLRATCDSWQDKYERLLEAHKRLQKVNQGLEDKLLRLVDRSESEKARLSQDTTNLTTALTTAAQAINRLKNENARYQKDLSLAIQLLQCNPSHYASHKLDMLPSELHQKVKSRLTPEAPKITKTEAKVIRVPIPTFPPTAMVYSINKCAEEKEKEEPVDMVSAAILAAILEERERERSKRHCPTCTCQMETNRNSSSPSNNNAKHSNSPDTFFYPESNNRESNEGEKSSGGNSSSLSTTSAGAPFDVNAIDVGTQTLPSYIGETGKVTSTCIYCQSVKTLSEINIHNADATSDNSFSGPPPYRSCPKKKSSGVNSSKNPFLYKSEGKRSSNGGTCPWDWHAESQDSGSPSTPTSLTSASLSYESETSCFTSPQDSPGHVSLHSVNGFIKGQEILPSASSADEGRIFIREETSSQSKEEKQIKVAKSAPISVVKKGGSAKAIYDRDSLLLPFRIPSSVFQEQDDTFTPIHISPSERRERLSSTDSDGLSTGSTSPKASAEFRLGPRNKASSRKKSPNPDTSESVVAKPRVNVRALKEIIRHNDIVLKDTYIGNNINFNKIEKTVNGCEDPVVISSTYTSSATETTL